MRKISAILLRLALFLLLLPALPGMAQDMRRPAPPERPEVWFPAFVQRLAERNIRFGVIHNGTFGSRENWMSTAINNVLRYRAANLPPPQQVIFQSWEACDPDRHEENLFYNLGPPANDRRDGLGRLVQARPAPWGAFYGTS